MNAWRTIWLVGMMGAGKSTLGPALARHLGRPFVDTDEEIEREQGCSVAEIFSHKGEAGFRALESDAIERAPAGAVVALGGGAIAQPGAPEELGRRGIVVYLHASPEALLSRVGDAGERPLLRGLSDEARRERLADLLEERRSAYESAAIRLEVENFLLEELVAEAAQRIQALEARRGQGA